jgi:hypothetical protein
MRVAVNGNSIMKAVSDGGKNPLVLRHFFSPSFFTPDLDNPFYPNYSAVHPMAKFLIYTDEKSERQHNFILRFHPQAYQTKQKRNGNGKVVWHKNSDDLRVVGQSEILEKSGNGENGGDELSSSSSSSVHLLTLYSEFLTYRDLPDNACLDEVVNEMGFRVVGKP